MDRQTTLGFILIAVILVAWMWYTTPRQLPQSAGDHAVPALSDSSEKKQTINEESKKASLTKVSVPDTLGRFFSASSRGVERVITIETEEYIGEISSRGGIIRKWELKKYKTWDKHPVQLIDQSKGGDFSLLFTTTDGKLINTKSLYFDVDLRPGSTIKLSGKDEYTLRLILPVGDGRIMKTLTFRNGGFQFDAKYGFIGMEGIIANYEYQVIWENGLRYSEHNSVDESNSAKAFSYAGGELTEIDAHNSGETPTSNTSGSTEWVAARNKYFAVALLPKGKKADGAYLEGEHQSAPDNGVVEKYSIGLKMPFKGSDDTVSQFTVFLGPLDFDLIKSFDRGLDHIMSLGWTWIRPLTEYVFIPLFQLLHSFIPNYGIVIIVFSIVIKLALHPLTKSSMASMRKMQALQPMMEEIREKHKDDPQKMNVQIMKLYKDYGINPAGGCLPLLLQMPILYALYSLFTGSIELRQASFFLWISDLSIPDEVVKLPFTIPIFGVHSISGLALLMGLTMFIQQKMTVKDPRQKAMVWLMPIMLTLLFNNLPSGLNLYYFVFNLLAIVQQSFFNKSHSNQPLQKVPEKKRQSGGILSALSRNLPKVPRK